jgi:hypothetical protein
MLKKVQSDPFARQNTPGRTGKLYHSFTRLSDSSILFDGYESQSWINPFVDLPNNRDTCDHAGFLCKYSTLGKVLLRNEKKGSQVAGTDIFSQSNIDWIQQWSFHL